MGIDPRDLKPFFERIGGKTIDGLCRDRDEKATLKKCAGFGDVFPDFRCQASSTTTLGVTAFLFNNAGQ